MNKTPLIVASCLAVAAACGKGDDNNGNNGANNNGGMNEPVKLPIASTGSIEVPDQNDADFSCLGQRTVPASTASVAAFRLEVKDFEDDFHTEGLKVQIFSDNVVDISACNPPNCVEGMTDSNGLVTGMGVPGTWFAYRVFPKNGPTNAETVVGSVQFNELVPAPGGMTDGISVSAKTLDLIPNVLGFARPPGTAIVAGRISDCKDEEVHGTRARLLENDVAIPEGAKQSEPHYRYFDGDSFPSATQPYTHVDGLFAAANLPVTGSRQLTVEIEGRLDGDAEPRLLSREHLRIFEDTVTVINVGPLRMEEANR